jgi:tetratricopeptide (TPR) repeat protein
LNIALTLKPDDKEVKKMLDEANRKLSEIKVKNEQYNKTIRLAQDALNSQRWHDAYTKSESALELRPDSSEAKRIYIESQRKIKLAESLKEFLLRADTFIGQKLYNEALEELNKAKYADANNKEIEERIAKIQSIQRKHKEELALLEQELKNAEKEEDFDKAIDLCNKLIDKDIQNPRKWNEHIVYLKERRNKRIKDIELLDSLKIKINEANFNEQWEELIELCNEALSIKSDESIKRYLEKARDKYKLIRNQKDFETLVSKVKTYIADRQWSEAKEIIKELQDKYPEKNDIIRNLYKQIFDAEEAWNDKLSDKKHTFSPKVEQSQRECHPPLRKDKQTKDSSFDDFFGKNNSKGSDQSTGEVSSSKGYKQAKDSSFDDFFGNNNSKGSDQSTGEVSSSKGYKQAKDSSFDDFFGNNNSKGSDQSTGEVSSSKGYKQAKDSSFDDFFGNNNSKGSDQSTGEVSSSKGYKQAKDSSFDDFFGNKTSKGAGKNTGKVPSSNGHNQPESPSGDSFFDSDTTNSKKTHRNQSKKQPLDDFFND